MSDCPNVIDCCVPNIFEYQVVICSGVNLRTMPSPSDGGTTFGDGDFAVGTDVTVTEIPSVPTSIDVGVDMVFVVDESGSMITDARAVLASVTNGLEARLNLEGIGSGTVANRYACVRFGYGPPASQELAFQSHTTFEVAATTIGGAPAPGLEEDAYEGIDFAINSMVWREQSSVSKVIFFITDTDRVGHNYAIGADQAAQFASLKAQLVAGGFVVAGMCHSGISELRDAHGDTLIAADYTGKGYAADGAGGYTVSTYGGAVNPAPAPNGDTADFPLTGQCEEYYDLAVDPDIKGYFFDLGWYQANPTAAQSVVSVIVPAMAERIVQELSWNFVGWYDEGGVLVSSDQSFTFPILANTVLTARFSY